MTRPETLTILQLMDLSCCTARAKGWWDDPRTFGDCIALAHSELSEALEEYRVDGDDCLASLVREESPYGPKPVGVASELADLFIRVADMCEYYGIPLAEAIVAKLEYNTKRPHRHGGKHL